MQKYLLQKKHTLIFALLLFKFFKIIVKRNYC